MVPHHLNNCIFIQTPWCCITWTTTFLFKLHGAASPEQLDFYSNSMVLHHLNNYIFIQTPWCCITWTTAFLFKLYGAATPEQLHFHPNSMVLHHLNSCILILFYNWAIITILLFFKPDLEISRQSCCRPRRPQSLNGFRIAMCCSKGHYAHFT